MTTNDDTAHRVLFTTRTASAAQAIDASFSDSDVFVAQVVSDHGKVMRPPLPLLALAREKQWFLQTPY
jgi:hypothetical protein